MDRMTCSSLICLSGLAVFLLRDLLRTVFPEASKWRGQVFEIRSVENRIEGHAHGLVRSWLLGHVPYVDGGRIGQELLADAAIVVLGGDFVGVAGGLWRNADAEKKVKVDNDIGFIQPCEGRVDELWFDTAGVVG